MTAKPKPMDREELKRLVPAMMHAVKCTMNTEIDPVDAMEMLDTLGIASPKVDREGAAKSISPIVEEAMYVALPTGDKVSLCVTRILDALGFERKDG